MKVRLDKSNVDREIRNYLRKIDAIEIPERQGTNLQHLLSLKRGKIKKGPYPDVSIFEASNRIFSDIVILFGIRELLLQPDQGKIFFPFTEYEARLGNENGFDIEANNGGLKLVGEAFNVARSFFPDKKRKMKAKLEKETGYDYRILIFNRDAVPDAGYYRNISEKSMVYLPVDWESGITEFISHKE
jgi:hypothetical protein